MSDVSQGPGWWQASDHKWYPPEAVPGSTPEPVAPAAYAPGTAFPTTTSALRSPRTRSATSSGGIGAVVLLVCGAVMIAGSIGAWFSASIFSFSQSEGGATHGGPGWISLVAGIVLIVVGLMGIVTAGNGLRLVGVLGAVCSGAGLGITVYLVDRFLSLPGSSVAHVGWGLILVLVTSIISLVASASLTLAAD
jgi:hypothetical protein